MVEFVKPRASMLESSHTSTADRDELPLSTRESEKKLGVAPSWREASAKVDKVQIIMWQLSDADTIGDEKQNFCACLYTMRGPFPLWSQLNTQVKA